MSRIVGQPSPTSRNLGRQRREMPDDNQRPASVTATNRDYWFQLIKLYEAIGDTDALHGIWRELAQTESLNAEAQEEDDHERSMNLIEKVQEMRANGRIGDALKELESQLQSAFIRNVEPSIKRELDTKRLSCKDELLKWGELSNELHSRHKADSLTEVVETKGPKHVELLLRSMLRSSSQRDNIKAALPAWLSDEPSK